MVKTIKIAGMDAYIKKFTPDTSNNAADSNAASESDSKSVKTTKNSTAKK